MIKQFSFFSLLLLGLGFIMFSCNNKESVSPAKIESSDFKSSIKSLFETYHPSAAIVKDNAGTRMMNGDCGPEIHNNCLTYQHVIDTVTTDNPYNCPVVVQATITICQDEDGNHLVSFVPEFYEVILPNPNNPQPLDQFCNAYSDAIAACIDAGDLACAQDLVDAMQASAADNYERKFISGYLDLFENSFPCDGPFARSVLRTEYFDASCIKVCEIGGPEEPVWQLGNCGSGCCIKTREYCQTESGGTSSGPLNYSYAEGLCADNTNPKACKTVIDCFSRSCPSD